jgi:hypothetical protein
MYRRGLQFALRKRTGAIDAPDPRESFGDGANDRREAVNNFQASDKRTSGPDRFRAASGLNRIGPEDSTDAET